SVICGPIGCAVDFVCRLLHLKIISLKKPLQIGLCNKAVHPYFDFIDNISWLDVKIIDRVIGTDINNCKKYDYIFEYYIKNNLACSVDINRIKKTFETLKINDNIVFDAQDFFNTELYYDLIDSDELGDLSDQELSKLFLKKSINLNKQGYGLNHWKVVLYKMLSTLTDYSYLKENPL
ncbi:hypothetical protein ABLT89_12810, partial [Acinetobacter schindleri]